MKVVIFFEGGGSSRIDREARQALKRFFEHTGFQGKLPEVVPCGHRGDAWKSFKAELERAKSGVWPMLLVDSEEPVRPENQEEPWNHLAAIGAVRLTRPSGATDDHVHLMVQCMESWFLADRDWLEL